MMRCDAPAKGRELQDDALRRARKGLPERVVQDDALLRRLQDDALRRARKGLPERVLIDSGPDRAAWLRPTCWADPGRAIAARRAS